MLVACVSKRGASGEISRRIAEIFCSAGYSVDLACARDVSSVDHYFRILLGSAVYMSRVLNESVSFARKFLAAESDKQIELFDVCLTMKENTPENVQTALGYLDVFSEFFTPAMVGAFAGRIDFDTLPFLYRQFAQTDQEDMLAEGDYRDWNVIDEWSRKLFSCMAGRNSIWYPSSTITNIQINRQPA